MLAIGVVVGVAVTLVAVLIPWLPDSASKQMDRITFTYWFATVICIAIFALVAAVIIYSVRTFKVQPGDESDGPPIHGHTGLEIVWTVIPAVLVVAIGVVSAVVLAQNGDAGTNPLNVRVVGQQFAWRFEYPDEDDLRSGRELVLPIDRTVELELVSVDVIHSFWVPDMGQKQDLVPGTIQRLVITPTKLGTFPIVCTELCGLGHPTMRSTVRVVGPQEFDQWVEETRAGAAGGDSGEQVFASAGCGGCHALEKAGTSAAIGPPLERAELEQSAQSAGQPLEQFVEESIVDPNKVIRSSYRRGVMPETYGDTLSQEQIDALVAYLAGAEE
jgi:cytochrome c oxidase subunit 2